MNRNTNHLHFLFLAPSLSIPTNLLVWKGALEYCRSKNIRLTVVAGRQWRPNSQFEYANSIYQLSDQKEYDGILLYGGALGFEVGETVLAEMLKILPEIPIFNIGTVLANNPNLIIDNFNGMKQGVDHLIKAHDCRRIAFIKGPEEHPEANQRLEGYYAALNENNLPVDDSLIFPGDFRISSGRYAVKELNNRPAPLPDAIAAVDDDTAYGVLELLQELHISVPQTIRVIGFDNSELGKSTDIPLTTIDQNLYGQGREGARLLHQIIQGENIPALNHAPMELIIRESCGCNQSLEDPLLDSGVCEDSERNLNLDESAEIFKSTMSQLCVNGDRSIIMEITAKFISSLSSFKSSKDYTVFDESFDFLKHFLRDSKKDFFFSQQFITTLEKQLLHNLSNVHHSWLRRNIENVRILIAKESQKKEVKRRMLSDYSIGEMNYFNSKLNDVEDLDDFYIHLEEMIDTFGLEQLYVVFCKSNGQNLYDKEVHFSYNPWLKRSDYRKIIPLDNEEMLPPYEKLQKSREPVIINSFYTRKTFFGYVIIITDELKSAFSGFISTQMANAYQRYQVAHEKSQKTRALEESLIQLHNTQKQLIESEKMAALGNLVAGVAHEINTPLGISITSSSFLQQEFEQLRNSCKDFEPSRIQTMENSIAMTLRNLHRAANLIRTFKNVAVDQTVDEIRTFHMAEYLEEIRMGLQTRLDAKKVELNWDCSPALSITNLPGPFFQIFTNLIINSLDHGFEESTEPGEINIHFEERDHFLIINYTDTGKGIDPKVKQRIFEPFVTTGRHKGNTGLGMHIIYNLITQTLQGTIQIQKSEKGAAFKLQIPKNR